MKKKGRAYIATGSSILLAVGFGILLFLSCTYGIRSAGLILAIVSIIAFLVRVGLYLIEIGENDLRENKNGSNSNRR